MDATMTKPRTKPANRQQYNMRLQRFQRGTLFSVYIPAIHASECKLLLSAFYGSKLKAGLSLVGDGLKDHGANLLWRFRLGISDRVGWTKTYDVPETETTRAYQMRHGWKCHGSPNCDNVNCINDSIPKWFRFLTGWRRL